VIQNTDSHVALLRPLGFWEEGENEAALSPCKCWDLKMKAQRDVAYLPGVLGVFQLKQWDDRLFALITFAEQDTHITIKKTSWSVSA